MANQLPAAYDRAPTMFTRCLDQQLVERGCIHLEPGWVATRKSDNNLYVSLDTEQTWPGILTVGAEALRGWKFALLDAPDDTPVSDGRLFSEDDGTWLAAARDQLYRALEVCIQKQDSQGNPKLREAFVDQFKLFTAMALAATALLSRTFHVVSPHDTATNVRRLRDSAKTWEADLAGGIVPGYPDPDGAALRAGFLPYPSMPWGVDEASGPAASVMTPIKQWAQRYWQEGSCSILVDSQNFPVRPAHEVLHAALGE